MSVLAANLCILLLASGLVVYHFAAPRADEPMVFTKLKSTPPPPKPPAMGGRSGSKTLLDPVAVVAPPPAASPTLVTTSSISVSNFSSLSIPSANSIDLPQASLPQGATLDQLTSDNSSLSSYSGSNPFGSVNADNGPALVGYLYDLKRNTDGSATNIQNDGYFKDRTLEHTYEAKWHWGRYIMSFANDPAKKDQLTDSMINEAKLINSLISDRAVDSLLEPYYRSKPLYAYQWSIANQTSTEIVKAFGVENDVKPTHIVIFYKGTVVAPRDGMFRFVCFSQGGAMAVRFNNELVAGHANWENPLISSQPFRFGGDVSSLPNGDTAGNWFRVVQGQSYPLEILLTGGDAGVSLHLMMQEEQPSQPYLPTGLQWDTLKQRPNPRISLRFPLFALRTGVPQAPFYPPSLNPPPPEAPDDVKQGFEKYGPGYQNPEVAPDPIVFPGAPN